MNVQHPDARSKHEWAVAKDVIIRDFAPVFLKALSRIGDVTIIDAYAGPGKYEDGSIGSPLIFLEEANKLYKQRLLSIRTNFIFIEREEEYLNILRKAITELTKDSRIGIDIRYGDADKLLPDIFQEIESESQNPVFLYLDPWGLKGIRKDIVIEFLKLRRKRRPVEILLRFPPLDVIRFYRNPQLGQNWIAKILGENWQDIKTETLLRHNFRDKAFELATGYKNRLLELIPDRFLYSVTIPVEGRHLYFMVFFSEHPFGAFKMNDAMVSAWRKHVETDRSYAGTIFGGAEAYSRLSLTGEEEKYLLETIQKHKRIKVHELVALLTSSRNSPIFVREPRGLKQIGIIKPNINALKQILDRLKEKGTIKFEKGAKDWTKGTIILCSYK